MKIEQRRRLTDLYSRGEEVKIDDGEGEPVILWIRKMTPADAELAYLKASAKRAAFLSMGKEDPPSDAYLTLKAQIDEFSKENLVLWNTTTEMIKREPMVESRVAHLEEWEKERYLESLLERTQDEDFKRKAEELPEDEEIVRVHKEIERFNAQVANEVEAERVRVEREKDGLSTVELGDMVLQNMLESQADAAWLQEFQKCQIWRCVFDGQQRSERAFQTRDEVDELQLQTIAALAEVIDRLHVPDQEGKDSQQTTTSSEESE